jgi:hypothetical protein
MVSLSARCRAGRARGGCHDGHPGWSPERALAVAPPGASCSCRATWTSMSPKRLCGVAGTCWTVDMVVRSQGYSAFLRIPAAPSAKRTAPSIKSAWLFFWRLAARFTAAMVSTGRRNVIRPRFCFPFGWSASWSAWHDSLYRQNQGAEQQYLCVQSLIVRTKLSIVRVWTKELLTTHESRHQDRFFVARIDGCRTMFVLHADHSVCIVSTTQPVTLVESTDVVLDEMSGLAA